MKITVELDRFTLDRDVLYQEFEQALAEAVKEKVEKLKRLLELSIEMGTLITLTDDQLRGLGKSTAIIEMANKLDAAVVVTNSSYLALHGRKINNLAVLSSVEGCRGLRFKNGFIVDEGVDDEIIKQLIRDGNKLLGGFKRL